MYFFKNCFNWQAARKEHGLVILSIIQAVVGNDSISQRDAGNCNGVLFLCNLFEVGIAERNFESRTLAAVSGALASCINGCSTSQQLTTSLGMLRIKAAENEVFFVCLLMPYLCYGF